jgi:hypothetical protein
VFVTQLEQPVDVRAARAGDRACRRRRHNFQSRAGRADSRFDLSVLRLHRAERDRGRDLDRPPGCDSQRRQARRRCFVGQRARRTR